MKTDGRALDHAMLTERRKRGVAAVQAGESPTLVAAALPRATVLPGLVG